MAVVMNVNQDQSGQPVPLTLKQGGVNYHFEPAQKRDDIPPAVALIWLQQRKPVKIEDAGNMAWRGLPRYTFECGKPLTLKRAGVKREFVPGQEYDLSPSDARHYRDYAAQHGGQFVQVTVKAALASDEVVPSKPPVAPGSKSAVGLSPVVAMLQRRGIQIVDDASPSVAQDTAVAAFGAVETRNLFDALDTDFDDSRLHQAETNKLDSVDLDSLELPETPRKQRKR